MSKSVLGIYPAGESLVIESCGLNRNCQFCASLLHIHWRSLNLRVSFIFKIGLYSYAIPFGGLLGFVLVLTPPPRHGCVGLWRKPKQRHYMPAILLLEQTMIKCTQFLFQTALDCHNSRHIQLCCGGKPLRCSFPTGWLFLVFEFGVSRRSCCV